MIRFDCQNVKMFCRDEQTVIQQQEDFFEEQLQIEPQSKVVPEQTSKSMARTKTKTRVMSEEYNGSSYDEVDQTPVSQSGEGIVPKMVGMVKKSANYLMTKSDKGILVCVTKILYSLPGMSSGNNCCSFEDKFFPASF